MITSNGIEIYQELREIVSPVHSCLVVWDVQNGLVDRIFNKDEFLRSLGGFVGTLRKKMPVVYTLITPPPRQYQSSWQLYSMMRRYNVTDPEKLPKFMTPGSKEREIPEAVKPADTDMLLDKPAASIFLGTNFENLMRNRGISTLIFTGIATEMGIESSARDASCRGFYPVVVSDCVSSPDKEAHDRSLKNMDKLMIVRNSGDVMKSLSS